jgi:2-oxo-4-hydroxy-4-carboxy-5-ureidoimidazoline decarboxylase
MRLCPPGCRMDIAPILSGAWGKLTPYMSTGVSAFNGLPAAVAQQKLLSCCASPVWARAVEQGRPYPDTETMLHAAEAASADLPWSQVLTALSAHPRIGERAQGDSHEARTSRVEQAEVGRADRAVRDQLAKVNQSYEERFGHISLVFAAGRSAQDLLAEACRRLANDPVAERAEVRHALTAIASRRLSELIS